MQVAATYDWRLPVAHMEHRDGTFTQMKAGIETLHSRHKEKVRLVIPIGHCGRLPSLHPQLSYL